jgi:hypothetical protein
MAKSLASLPDCAHTIVYQMVVAAIKADPVMAATVSATSWTTYLDEPSVVRNVAIDNNGYPCVRMMPFGGPVGPEANVIQNADLGIAITVTTAGHDVRDIMNLWGALSRSVFTGDGAKTLANSIRAALAAAGQAQNANIGSLQSFYLGLSGIGPSTDSAGNRFMTAEGVIVAKMTVPK